MQTFPVEQRQMMGCGHAPPHPSAMPWQPPSGAKGYAHKKPTVCVGYTSNLPEVNEAVIARVHWKNGALSLYTEGQPTELLLGEIIELEAADNQAQGWAMTPKKDGGGLDV